MQAGEMFASARRSAGDLAGVFEYDGETAYFYLYRAGNEGNRVLASIHVLSGLPDFQESDVEVRWNGREENVGLFIRGELWAVFNGDTQAKHGGDYHPGTHPELPAVARLGFGSG
jgi:hypothetical protein